MHISSHPQILRTQQRREESASIALFRPSARRRNTPQYVRDYPVLCPKATHQPLDNVGTVVQQLTIDSIPTGSFGPGVFPITDLHPLSNRSINPRVPQPGYRPTARVHGIVPTSTLQPRTQTV